MQFDLRFHYPDHLYDCYDLPMENHDKVNRLAARCGRTLGEGAKHDAAKASLLKHMRTLNEKEIAVWRSAIMIDRRWCGATGQGGFWAAASGVCNTLAWKVWEERHGPAFEVI